MVTFCWRGIGFGGFLGGGGRLHGDLGDLRRLDISSKPKHELGILLEEPK